MYTSFGEPPKDQYNSDTISDQVKTVLEINNVQAVRSRNLITKYPELYFLQDTSGNKDSGRYFCR